MQWFPFAVLIEATDTIHAAVFFYEFVWCLLVFAALWFLLRKRMTRDGGVTIWYLLLYPAGHIAAVLLRQNTSYLFGGARTTVLINAVLIVFAVAVLVVRARKPAAPSGEPESEEGDNTTDEPADPETPEPLQPDGAEAPGLSDNIESETEQPEAEPADTDGEPTGKEAQPK
jgi:hypothetical protein